MHICLETENKVLFVPQVHNKVLIKPRKRKIQYCSKEALPNFENILRYFPSFLINNTEPSDEETEKFSLNEPSLQKTNQKGIKPSRSLHLKLLYRRRADNFCEQNGKK